MKSPFITVNTRRTEYSKPRPVMMNIITIRAVYHNGEGANIIYGSHEDDHVITQESFEEVVKLINKQLEVE